MWSVVMLSAELYERLAESVPAGAEALGKGFMFGPRTTSMPPPSAGGAMSIPSSMVKRSGTSQGGSAP